MYQEGIIYRGNTFSPQNVFHCGCNSTHVRILEDKLTASLIADGEDYIILATKQLKPASKTAYFEMEVLTEGGPGCIEFGLATSNNRMKHRRDVEALQLNHNIFYKYSSLGKQINKANMYDHLRYGTKFGLGDIVGCTLTRRREILFTLNGRSLGTGFNVGQEEFKLGLYPCINFSRIGWKIRANFGNEPFLRDILKMTWSSVQKSKGIELSDENLTAKMITNHLARQPSTNMAISTDNQPDLFYRYGSDSNLTAGLVQATSLLKPSLSNPGYFEISITQEDETSLFHIDYCLRVAILQFLKDLYVVHILIG